MLLLLLGACTWESPPGAMLFLSGKKSMEKRTAKDKLRFSLDPFPPYPLKQFVPASLAPAGELYGSIGDSRCKNRIPRTDRGGFPARMCIPRKLPRVGIPTNSRIPLKRKRFIFAACRGALRAPVHSQLRLKGGRTECAPAYHHRRREHCYEAMGGKVSEGDRYPGKRF